MKKLTKDLKKTIVILTLFSIFSPATLADAHFSDTSLRVGGLSNNEAVGQTINYKFYFLEFEYDMLKGHNDSSIEDIERSRLFFNIEGKQYKKYNHFMKVGIERTKLTKSTKSIDIERGYFEYGVSARATSKIAYDLFLGYSNNAFIGTRLYMDYNRYSSVYIDYFNHFDKGSEEPLFDSVLSVGLEFRF